MRSCHAMANLVIHVHFDAAPFISIIFLGISTYYYRYYYYIGNPPFNWHLPPEPTEAKHSLPCRFPRHSCHYLAK